MGVRGAVGPAAGARPVEKCGKWGQGQGRQSQRHRSRPSWGLTQPQGGAGTPEDLQGVASGVVGNSSTRLVSEPLVGGESQVANVESWWDLGLDQSGQPWEGKRCRGRDMVTKPSAGLSGHWGGARHRGGAGPEDGGRGGVGFDIRTSGGPLVGTRKVRPDWVIVWLEGKSSRSRGERGGNAGHQSWEEECDIKRRLWTGPALPKERGSSVWVETQGSQRE